MSEWFADIWVPGKPETQGSLQHVGRGRMINKPALLAWRGEVQRILEQWVGTYFGTWEPVEGAVEMHGAFYLPKPKSNKQPYPIGRRSGDADKYFRAAGDAVSLGAVRLIADDAQVIDLRSKKRWAHGIPEGEDGHEPGVRIRVRRIE